MSFDGIIREAVTDDAEQLILHTKQVLREHSDVLAATVDEFNMTKEEEVEWIQTQKLEGLILVAEVEGKIVGMLNFRLSPRKQFSHTGMFGMSIQEKYTNKGIGSALLKRLLEWAETDERVEKISLEVFSNNLRAIQLYKKFGFKEEGRMHKKVKFGPNEYVDQIVMGKWIRRNGK